MEIAWGKIAPVIVSIIIIIFIAIIREYSKTFAAIAVTMPINLPLGIWLVYGSSTKVEMEHFTRSLAFNLVPTFAFVVIAWLAARAGWKMIPMVVAGYAGWGVGLFVLMLVRRAIGF